ncbi:GAF domain-containing protein [Nocardioides sp. 503]|uniref:GAF domain-containing protein n=1 Tax=Nocardioides sp. 503 TaxID=2508326 RepID=UPI00106F6223|nr:GAF domain-containing protein [Nocardioides sp. 503]
MEPIPETVRAIEDFGPFEIEDEDLVEELRQKAAQIRAVVPQCVGLSISPNEDHVTFTLVATAAEIALLDGVQYLDGGPCVEAGDAEQVLSFDREGLDENEWQMLAQATSALGVASTLTLPILQGTRVVGSVNLYASTPHGFDGHHREIAAILGAWAPGAVTNADLSFSTRKVAEHAPEVLRADVDLTVAWAIIARRDGTDLDAARLRLREAARRAGVSEAELAATVIDLELDQDLDPE